MARLAIGSGQGHGMRGVLTLDTCLTHPSASLVCLDGAELKSLTGKEFLSDVQKDGVIYLLRAVLNDAAIDLRDPRDSISGIAVTIGPGGFTSIRSGLATVEALSLVWGIPVVGVSVIAAFAIGKIHAKGVKFEGNYSIPVGGLLVDSALVVRLRANSVEAWQAAFLIGQGQEIKKASDLELVSAEFSLAKTGKYQGFPSGCEVSQADITLPASEPVEGFQLCELSNQIIKTVHCGLAISRELSAESSAMLRNSGHLVSIPGGYPISAVYGKGISARTLAERGVI